jgi:putative membrane protein
MKSTLKIKTAALQVIFASSIIFGAASCENKEKDHNDVEATKALTPEVAEDQNEDKFNKNADEKNAEFLVKAAEINLEEISLGKLAQKKSMNKDVKELGKMMETAHTKALADLQKLASKKIITIPTELPEAAKNMYDNFDGKSEKDFNMEYVDKMVSGHKDAIELFEKHSTDSKDEDIKTWATAMLPELRTHLDGAVAIQEKLSKLK